MKPRTASIFVRTTAGAMIGCFVFFVIGCPTGCAIGWQIAYHENDGGSEVLYSRNPPVSKSTDFWFVHYDEHDEPTLQKASGPVWRRPPGLRLRPVSDAKATRDTWSGPKAPTYKNSTVPAGDHDFQSGEVLFYDDVDALLVKLIVAPRNAQDGWIRVYYTYEVGESNVRLVSSRRERSFNDFGLFVPPVYAAIVAIPAMIFGSLLGATVGYWFGANGRIERTTRSTSKAS